MGGKVVSDFLAGGEEMGALTRGYDWPKTSLGSPETWPQSLRVTVRLVLTTRHPMFISWGTGLIPFYNDAYRETMGPERRPTLWEHGAAIVGMKYGISLALRSSTSWQVTGRPGVSQLVPVIRHASSPGCPWTYSFSPIDFEGKVGGVLVVCKDVA